METTARNRTIGGIVIGAIILILLLVLFSCTVNGDPNSSPTNDPTPGESSSLPSDPDTIEPEEDPSESESESDEPEEIDGDDIVPAANTGVTFIPAGNVPSGSTPTCDLDPSACEPNRPPGAGVDICEIRPDLNQCQPPTPPTTPPGDGEPTTPPDDGDDDCFLGIGLLCEDPDPTPPPTPGDKKAPSCGTRPVVVEKSITELILVTLISYEVSWGAASDDSGSVEYRVYVDDERVATTSNTSYRSGGLELDPTKEYRLSVEAVDPSGNTAKCGRVKLTDNVDPVMGEVGCEVLSNTEVRLTWPEATDDSGEIQHYTVSTDGLEPVTTETPGGTVKGLSPDTTYTFEVTATDWSDNDSEPSTVECTTTADETAPSNPTGLKATTVTSNSVALAWSASTDDSAIDYYEVTYARVDGGLESTESTDGPVTTVTVSPLLSSTAYKFTVAAVDVAGTKSGSSNEVTATTTAIGAEARTIQPRTLKKPSTEAPAEKSAEKPAGEPTDEKSPLLPGLGDILPGGEDAAEAPVEEPAAPEAEPSESESPAARPTTEEPAEEPAEAPAEEPTTKASEDAPAEEEKDEDGLLKNIGDAVVSAVAAVF